MLVGGHFLFLACKILLMIILQLFAIGILTLLTHY